MNGYLSLFTFVFAVLSFQSAQANIVVSFVEGAPKDRFVIENNGACPFDDLIVEIDLSASAGRLIFDTTASGAGVEVFQPFEITEGDVQLLSGTNVRDGDSVLTVKVTNLLPETTASFTIDVDDQLPQGELGMTRVSGSEIENSLASVTFWEHQLSTAAFSADSVAVVPTPACQA